MSPARKPWRARSPMRPRAMRSRARSSCGRARTARRAMRPFMRITWPCKDGFVNFQFSGGASSGQSVNNFVRWMADEGMGDAYMQSLDFKALGYGTVTREMLDRIVPPVCAFPDGAHQAGAVRRRDRAAHPVVSGRHARAIFSPIRSSRRAGFFQTVEYPGDRRAAHDARTVRARQRHAARSRAHWPRASGSTTRRSICSELGLARADLHPAAREPV